MASKSVEKRRALTSEQLTRSMAQRVGLVIDRTHGPNRWPGRPIVSQIAAASAGSFLLRRT
jgi:hypothetical protein